MKKIINVKEMKAWSRSCGEKSIGFVPTMGNLHAGHASLIQRARAENDFVVVSIFVNATQFNDSNDFNNYPKTLDDDLSLLASLDVDVAFVPEHAELYEDDYRFKVLEKQESLVLEGVYRPGHFDGVLTVVMKLLLLIKPTRAYFGEKDYQQYCLIRDMAKTFFLDAQIVGCPTVRNEEGLALSSRNNRLTDMGLKKSSVFYAALKMDVDDQRVVEHLNRAGFEVEYIKTHQGRRFGAVFVEGVRLIDNVDIVSERA